MNKQNRRFLACAVALATSFAAVPGVSHAEVTAKPAGQAATAVAAESAGTASAPAVANTSAPAEKTAEMAAQQGNAQEDKRTADWGKNRPQEDAIEKYSKEYEGQTIVDTVFEGTTAVSEATAKASLSMKTGDMFTVNGMNKDREAIYNTGYFYDLFPTF